MNFKAAKKPAANKEFDSSGSDDGMDSDSFDAVLGTTPEKERAAPKRAAGTLADFFLKHNIWVQNFVHSG